MIVSSIKESAVDSACRDILAGRDSIVIDNEIGRDPDIIHLVFRQCLCKIPEVVNINVNHWAVSYGKTVCIKTQPHVGWNKFRNCRCTFTMEDSKRLSGYANKVAAELSLASKNEMNKVIAIYEYLTDTVEYEDSDNAHTAWGALIDRKAVCEGISFAFCLLAKKCGLESTIVDGLLDGGDHAWNIVKVDGVLYHVDATDGVSRKERGVRCYDGLFLKDSDMIDYVWDKKNYPPCNADRLNYFIASKSFADSEAQAIEIISRQLLKHKVVYFRCSNRMNADKESVLRMFKEACERTNTSCKSTVLYPNLKIKSFQIIYER